LRDSYYLFLNNFAAKINERARQRARTINTKAIVEAVMRNPINIITHPGLQVPIDTFELAKACSRRNTALEINTSHQNVTIDFIKAAKTEGALFAINSDAHSPGRVGDLDSGIMLARQAGLQADDIINAIE
jgi:putative hydrolase